MSIIVRPQVNVNAGDLAFCQSSGRAGFFKRSGLSGDEIEVVDNGVYIVAVMGAEALYVEQQLYISTIGAPTTEVTSRPLGVIRAVMDHDNRTASVEINA